MTDILDQLEAIGWDVSPWRQDAGASVHVLQTPERFDDRVGYWTGAPDWGLLADQVARLAGSGEIRLWDEVADGSDDWRAALGRLEANAEGLIALHVAQHEALLIISGDGRLEIVSSRLDGVLATLSADK